jgi:hypothetical protein
VASNETSAFLGFGIVASCSDVDLRVRIAAQNVERKWRDWLFSCDDCPVCSQGGMMMAGLQDGFNYGEFGTSMTLGAVTLGYSAIGKAKYADDLVGAASKGDEVAAVTKRTAWIQESSATPLM